jgi:hypothetical protein
MRLRDQLIGAVLVAGVTWVGLHRIAEAKSEASVGGGAFRLAEPRRAEMEAFARVRRDLARFGQEEMGARLERLRAEGELWVAPGLDPGRWAVYSESLGLVRRIYVRQEALLRPADHLFHGAESDAPPTHRQAFARLSLGGALAHELAHRDGLIEEAAAYDRELAWYADVRDSSFLAGLEGEERRAYEWALESAVLSAEEARRRAAADGPSS